MYINNKKFKKYNENYYVSADGEVYSKISNKILKKLINVDGYYYVDIHGKHKKIHKLVYTVWVRPLRKGEQVNHIDDNKHNNHYSNLYAGTQKENISDEFKNNHRVGNIIALTIYDSDEDMEIVFPSIKDFIDYSGHSCKSGSLSKLTSKKWFRNRYILISRERVETIKRYNHLKKKYQKIISSI